MDGMRGNEALLSPLAWPGIQTMCFDLDSALRSLGVHLTGRRDSGVSIQDLDKLEFLTYLLSDSV